MVDCSRTFTAIQNKINREQGMLKKPIFILLALLMFSTQARAEINTANIYTNVEKSVYQIRVINKQTGKKSSIGSGFVVNKDDILATNYHVVSEYINDPDVFQL
jgi:S1-C subfamily serine protease